MLSFRTASEKRRRSLEDDATRTMSHASDTSAGPTRRASGGGNPATMRTNSTSARCPVYSTPANFADARSFCVDNGKKLEGAKQPREREKNPERSPTSGPRPRFSALLILTSSPVTNGSQALLHQRSVCDEGRCCRKHHEDSYSTTCPSYRRGYAPYRRPTSDPMARKQSHSRSHRASRRPRPADALLLAILNPLLKSVQYYQQRLRKAFRLLERGFIDLRADFAALQRGNEGLRRSCPPC